MKSIKIPTSNQSSDKMLRIMEYLAIQEDPLALKDIAAPLGMSKSTVLRFLTTLSKNGYLAQEPTTSKYYLTYKLCALGKQIQEKQKLSNLTESYLREVAQKIGETVCFAIPQDDQVVYLDVVEAPGKTLKAMQRIGNIAPIHCSGIGKVFLSSYSEKELDYLIDVEGLEKYTEKTIGTKVKLMDEIEKIKESGHAIDDEESEVGMKAIAFPVYGYGEDIVAGFSVVGPTMRLTDEFMEQWLPYLRLASSNMTKLLGY